MCREMTAQAPAGGVADLQFFDQGGIVQSALVEITASLRGSDPVAVDRKRQSARALQRRVVRRSGLLIQVGEALAEGQMAGQLDKANQIAALAAAVAVEDILAGVDIERRPGLVVQRTEPDELGTATGRLTGPVLLPQIIQQRHSPLECFDVLAHSAFLPPEPSVGGRRRQSQARMVGERNFFKDAKARELAEPESSRTTAPLRQ